MDYCGKAKKASEEYKIKAAEEKVKLAVMSYQVNKEETTLYDELIKIEGLSEISSSGENNEAPYFVIVDGYKFKVNDDLSIEYLGKEGEANQNLPEITKVEYEKGEVIDALTVSITAKTADIKGIKEINVYYKKVEGEKIALETLELQEVNGQEATVTVTIPINGDYVIQAIGENNKIGRQTISISNIKEGSVLASITGGDVTNEATATIKMTGRGQGRAIQKMELFIDGKSAKTYEYKDLNTVREENYTLENLEFYKDIPCYIKTWDSKGEEKTSETKTVTNTKIIKTATDLRNLAIQVNEKDNTFEGRTIQLMDNITTGEKWIPIGYWNGGDSWTEKSFAGTFEGNSHTITITSSNKDTIYKSNGLFGQGLGCTINNVTVDGNLDANCAYVGGIIGFIKDGTISNCINNSVIADTTQGKHGGIVGSIDNSQVSHCDNTNTIYGKSEVGGICGSVVNSTGTDKKTIIFNCTNSGIIKCYDVSGEYGRVGGICGQTNVNSKIEKCTNLGEITGNAETTKRKGIIAGGIVGQLRDSEVVTSKNIIPKNVITKKERMVHCDITSENVIENGALGGVVGNAINSTINQCFNEGIVTSNEKTSRIGGIVGYSSGSTTKNSYNIGDICGYSEVGGMIGKSNIYESNNNYAYNLYNASESILGSSVTGNLAGNCTYITGNYTASLTGKTEIGSKGTSCNITNKTYSLTQMKTLNSGLLTLLSNGEGKGIWAQEAGVNGGLPYLVENRP